MTKDKLQLYNIYAQNGTRLLHKINLAGKSSVWNAFYFTVVPKKTFRNMAHQLEPASKKASPVIWQSSDIRVFSVYVYQPVSPLWSASGSPASDSAYSGSGSETTSSQRSNSAFSPGIGAELSPLKSQSFELDQLSQVDTMVSNGSWYEPPQPQEWISLFSANRMGVCCV